MSTTKAIEIYRYHLEPGGIFTCGEAAMVSAVLGTCVAVCLHDRRLKTGGMNHFLYPKAKLFELAGVECGTVSMETLLKMMRRQGSRIEDIEAQIFGGSELPGVEGTKVGLKNVKMARKILKKNGIKVVSEDVGGLKGRRLIFHTGTNEALVMKSHRLRRGDYYPYRQRVDA